MDNIEQDFYDAIKRIQQGQPRNLTLKNKQSNRTPIKLTISSIALEADRSRTLIGHRGCAYPKLRAHILNIIKQSAESPAQNQQEANRRLREKNDALSAQLNLARTEQANMLAYCIRLEREVSILKKTKSRVKV